MAEQNSLGAPESQPNTETLEATFGDQATSQNGNGQSEQPEVSAELEEADSDSSRPVLELFVKAAVDKLRNGGCPTCHRYFLIFYILREKGLIDLVVTTFLPENPPKEVLDISSGKHYPLVKVHKGIDSYGNDMTGIECDTVDEIEALVSRFDCKCMMSSRQSVDEALAEKCLQNLYTKFMQFLKSNSNDSSHLCRYLESIDSYLKENETRFMVSDEVSRADCYIMPSLQHIRVVGKYYKSFDMPTELTYLWRYMKNCYETPAFKESCPADREIITHYDGKVPSGRQLGIRSKLMGDERTFSIPGELNS